MFRFNRMCALALTAALLGLAAKGQSPVPVSDDVSLRLDKNVANYNLGTFNFVEALIRVAADFRIPMGISWINAPPARAAMPFAWKAATVRQIIQDIANAEPGYSVQVRDGVAHIFPESIPDRENFLKMKIEDFSAHDAYVEVASFKLHTLVTPRTYGMISIGATGDSKVDVELKGRTVADCLDALALASNRRIWIVTFTDEKSLTANGFRKTSSLWTDKPTPDEEQPIWQLMRWGDPIPPLVLTTKPVAPGSGL
jgi:hypothetical protein